MRFGGDSMPSDVIQFEHELLESGWQIRQFAFCCCRPDLVSDPVAGLQEIVNVYRNAFDFLGLVSCFTDPVLKVFSELPVLGHHRIGTALIGIWTELIYHPLDSERPLRHKCDVAAPRAA